MKLIRQKAVLVQKVQARVRLLLREVARRAGDDDDQIEPILAALGLPVLAIDVILPDLGVETSRANGRT
jgi:hypothetical protein